MNPWILSLASAAESTAGLHTGNRPARGRFSAGTRIGNYELIRQLGQGGMGSVHLARDLRLGRLVAIKFLTQSNWSHSAFYSGPVTGRKSSSGEECCLVEAELNEGVIASPLSKYTGFNIRICRPMGLSEADRARVVDSMVSSIGKQYDLKHVFDLLRYFLPTPPVPTRYRRQMIALGSGDPTRAICSSLIADCFQSVRYPILPFVEKQTDLEHYEYSVGLIYHIRHHSLFVPRDFDNSPYFEIVKPKLQKGFDYRQMNLVDTREK